MPAPLRDADRPAELAPLSRPVSPRQAYRQDPIKARCGQGSGRPGPRTWRNRTVRRRPAPWGCGTTDSARVRDNGAKAPHTPRHAADRPTADPRIPEGGQATAFPATWHAAAAAIPMQPRPPCDPRRRIPPSDPERIARPDLRRMPRIRKDYMNVQLFPQGARLGRPQADPGDRQDRPPGRWRRDGPATATPSCCAPPSACARPSPARISSR